MTTAASSSSAPADMGLATVLLGDLPAAQSVAEGSERATKKGKGAHKCELCGAEPKVAGIVHLWVRQDFRLSGLLG